MGWILLLIATLFLFLGHLFKVYRWQQFIEIYEKPQPNNLLQSLSLGYIINFIVPFRIGDLFRVWYSGRKMKNGISFSLVSVIIDRILDIICVALIFSIIYFLGFQNPIIADSALFYFIAAIIIFLFIILAFFFNKTVKVIIKKIASIFNSSIELKILKTSWFGINSCKDIFVSLNKFKLIINTVLMWLFYLTSYFLLAKSLAYFNYSYSFVEVFMSLFSHNTLNISMIAMLKDITNNMVWVMFLFITLPLFYLLILSFMLKHTKVTSKKEDIGYLELLPHVKEQDKLTFLEAYFSGQSREFFRIYLKLNQDISILQDFSKGSNATTLLCSKNEDTFFRKYVIGKDSEKLYNQVLWLKEHQNIPITKVLNVKQGKNYCCYDMPYNNKALSYFNFIHSSSIIDGWQIIAKIFQDLETKLYVQNPREAKKENINQYIETKVLDNLKKIMEASYIKPLLKYDYLIINGKKYHNLKYFFKYLNQSYLYQIFKNDKYSDIHGDLTIENIIVMGKKYYLIDPNLGNIHESKFLDYAKLLQSLHGNYEFFMNTKTIEIDKNHLNYLFTKSVVYEKLFLKYQEYLNQKFSLDEIKSIYFHEVVCWLRLLPYKIAKNGKRAVLFYAGLIIVLNDIIEKYGEEK